MGPPAAAAILAGENFSCPGAARCLWKDREEEGGKVGQQVWEGGTSAHARHTDSPDRRGIRAGTSASGDTALLPAEALKPDFRASCGGAGGNQGDPLAKLGLAGLLAAV